MLDQQCERKGADFGEDTPTFGIKQVEVNTMAPGMNGLCGGSLQMLHQ